MQLWVDCYQRFSALHRDSNNVEDAIQEWDDSWKRYFRYSYVVSVIATWMLQS